jgi:hypothetical protein
MNISCNDFLTLERLYELSSDDSYEYRYKHIKTLFEEERYQVTYSDEDIVYPIMEYHLTSDCDIRIIELLIQYNVMGDIRFQDYDDYIPNEYGDLDLNITNLFVKNLRAKNMVQLRFQIEYSINLKNIDIYLYSDEDIYLSILNYVYSTISDSTNLLNLLIEFKFEDYRTFNYHHDIHRPLSCMESACMFGSVNDLQFFIDYNTEHLENNMIYTIMYMVEMNEYSDKQLLCFQLLLKNVSKKSNIYRIFCNCWNNKWQHMKDHTLYKIMRMFIERDKISFNIALSGAKGLNDALNCEDIVWCIKEYL